MRRGSEGAGGTVSDAGVTLRRISADVDAAWPETRCRRGARRHVVGEQKLAGSTKKSSSAMMGTTDERYADEGGRAVSREVHWAGNICRVPLEQMRSQKNRLCNSRSQRAERRGTEAPERAC